MNRFLTKRLPKTGPALLTVLLLLLAVAPPALAREQEPAGFLELEAGLELASFKTPVPGVQGGAEIVVLRADPAQFELAVHSASQHGTGALTPADWASRFSLVACINASMYQQDNSSSTGYLENLGHRNNPWFNPRFGAFLVFNPKDPAKAPVRLVDREEEKDWKAILSGYRSVVQNYRLIDKTGKNVWKAGGRRHPTAAVGVDRSGRVLFIFCASQATVHELGDALLSLSLDPEGVMYVEGGPPAALYVNTGACAGTWMGGLNLWPMPNVLGLKRKAPAPVGP